MSSMFGANITEDAHFICLLKLKRIVFNFTFLVFTKQYKQLTEFTGEWTMQPKIVYSSVDVCFTVSQ